MSPPLSESLRASLISLSTVANSTSVSEEDDDDDDDDNEIDDDVDGSATIAVDAVAAVVVVAFAALTLSRGTAELADDARLPLRAVERLSSAVVDRMLSADDFLRALIAPLLLRLASVLFVLRRRCAIASVSSMIMTAADSSVELRGVFRLVDDELAFSDDVVDSAFTSATPLLSLLRAVSLTTLSICLATSSFSFDDASESVSSTLTLSSSSSSSAVEEVAATLVVAVSTVVVVGSADFLLTRNLSSLSAAFSIFELPCERGRRVPPSDERIADDDDDVTLNDDALSSPRPPPPVAFVLARRGNGGGATTDDDEDDVGSTPPDLLLSLLLTTVLIDLRMPENSSLCVVACDDVAPAVVVLSSDAAAVDGRGAL